MTQIFLVRHGEAEGNLYRRAQGGNDTDLTARGRRQILSLGPRFAETALDAAYTSDLRRARATALAALGGRDVPLHTEPRLREMCFGVWEDRPWGQIDREEMDKKIAFLTDPDAWYVPGAERFSAVQDRMAAALTDIARRHDGGTVLCASHGMAIRAFLSRIRGIPSREIARVKLPDNTAVTLLRWEEGTGFETVYENDVTHLPEKPITPLRPLGTDAARSWDLWFEPWRGEREEYLACYRDAWRLAHGDLRGFDADALWLAALYRLSRDDAALIAARRGEEFAGLLGLDSRRDAHRGAGWITFFYLKEDFRGHRCAWQLLGEAVSRYRALGRRCLRLTAAPSNPALGFYERAGFVCVGQEPGAVEPLRLMEMRL